MQRGSTSARTTISNTKRFIQTITPWFDTIHGAGLCFCTYAGGPAGGYILLENESLLKWHQEWFKAQTFDVVEGDLWFNPKEVEGPIDLVLLHIGQPEPDAIKYDLGTLIEAGLRPPR